MTDSGLDMKDKVVLVTGGSRGIGKAIVLEFARRGATVVFTYLANDDAARAVAAEAAGLAGSVSAHRADGRDPEAVDKLVEKTIEEHEKIDVLVNNAGVIKDTLLVGMPEEDWDKVMDTNLGGAFHYARAVGAHMLSRRSGRIINISSIAGSSGGRGQVNYAASKGAINAMTRALAVELAPRGVTVNAVAPGMVETEMSGTVRALTKDKIRDMIPLGRYGSAEDVAGVVAFFAGDAASYVTGQVVTVDGGLTLGSKW